MVSVDVSVQAAVIAGLILFAAVAISVAIRYQTARETENQYVVYGWPEARRRAREIHESNAAALWNLQTTLATLNDVIHVRKPDVPACTPEERALAEAVLKGDRVAACALADKVREA